jgi:NhaP-type Na+/H+ or K+/H+ antiporter
MLLGPVMVWGWLVTAGFILLLVPGMDFLNSLVVAACVTPTDPILAQAVVGGPWAEKHVPAHLRHMLQCESGCNDGAAFPFLYLALFLTTTRGHEGKGIAEWFYDALAYQIIFGTILGAVIGWAARKAMRFSERRRLVDRESFVAQYVSLAIASMGVNVLLGSDDLLAAFACGTAFAWDGWFTKQTEDSNFSNIVDLLFNTATFIYIGALMPWYEFAHAAGSLNIWRCFVLAIAVLSLKRIPIILALWRWIPDIKTFREAMFSGHFGPMGVGAIFIATLGRHELPEEIPEPPETSNDVLALTIQPIVFFLVLCSVAVHGLTVPFFAFSKRATTITRTWSRHPSFADGGEPGWMGRLKRYTTGDTMRSVKEDGNADGMTEIQRVLNAQLGVIGKGAIGGDAEKELRGESSSNGQSADGSADDSSGSRTRFGLLNTRTERDLELAEGDLNEKVDDDNTSQRHTKSRSDRHNRTREECDDLDDWEADEVEDPSCEWGGDNTAEYKLFKAKQAERKEARRKQREREREGDDGDLGEAPMDRELISGDIDESDEDEDVRKDKEGHERRRSGIVDAKDEAERKSIDKFRDESERYPKARSWLEGNQLVIEYMEHRSSEPLVRVVELSSEEADRIAHCSQDEENTVAASWMNAHRDELDDHVEDSAHRDWHPAEAARKLVTTGALQSWISSGKDDRSGRDKSSKSGNANRDQSQEETEQERQDRAAMMYEAMNWRKGDEGEDDDERSSATPGSKYRSRDETAGSSESSSRSGSDGGATLSPLRSSSRASPNRSKSPPTLGRRSSSDVTSSKPTNPRQHLAYGGRRPSMRRKVLAGKGYLGGQDASDSVADGSDNGEDYVDEDASSQDPRRGLESSGSSGLLRTPEDVKMGQRERAANRTPSASVSFLDTGDTRHDRVDGAPGVGFRKQGSFRRRKDGRDSGASGQRSSASQPSGSQEPSFKDKALSRINSAGEGLSGGGNTRSAPQSPPHEGPTTLTFTSPLDERENPMDSSVDEGPSRGSKSAAKGKRAPGRLSAFLSSFTASSSSGSQSHSQPTSATSRDEDSSASAPDASQSERGRPTSASGPAATGGIQAFQLPPSSAANENPDVLAALEALNSRNRGAGGEDEHGTGGGQQTPGSAGSRSQSRGATPGPTVRTHLEGNEGRSEGILSTPENSGINTPNEGAAATGSVAFAPAPSRD